MSIDPSTTQLITWIVSLVCASLGAWVAYRVAQHKTRKHVESRLDAVTRQYGELSDYMGTVLKQTSTQYDWLSHQNKDIREELLAVQGKLIAALNTLSERRDELAEVNDRLGDIVARNTALENEKAMLTKRIDELEDRVAILEDENRRLVKENAALRRRATDHNLTVDGELQLELHLDQAKVSNGRAQ